MIKNKKNFSFGELFKSSFDELNSKFKIIFKSFLFIYLLPLVVLLVIFLLIFVVLSPHLFISGNAIADLSSGTAGLSIFDSENLPISSTIFLIFVLIFGLLSGILMFFLSLSYLNISLSNKSKLSFSEVFSKTKKYFWKYLWFIIATSFLLMILYLLLIVPGIIFTIYWIFASYIFIIENKSVMQSLKKSKQIVRGNWWNVFGYIVLLALICVGVSIIFNLIPIVGSLLRILFINSFAIIFIKNFYLKMKN